MLSYSATFASELSVSLLPVRWSGREISAADKFVTHENLVSQSEGECSDFSPKQTGVLLVSRGRLLVYSVSACSRMKQMRNE
jgi:hypothetical protein